jgi:hypothetical protein
MERQRIAAALVGFGGAVRVTYLNMEAFGWVDPAASLGMLP